MKASLSTNGRVPDEADQQPPEGARRPAPRGQRRGDQPGPQDRPEQSDAEQSSAEKKLADWLNERAWAADWSKPSEPDGHSASPQSPLTEFGTPVRVDEIAVAALALSENLQAASRDLPESVALSRYRRELGDAAEHLRSLAGELETTAGDLVRLAATEGSTCQVSWGVCPEHGLTVMRTGEVATCHVLGCHRPSEGVVESCPQPVAYRVVDVAGPALMSCAGHALACRLHLDNPVITLTADSFETL